MTEIWTFPNELNCICTCKSQEAAKGQTSQEKKTLVGGQHFMWRRCWTSAGEPVWLASLWGTWPHGALCELHHVSLLLRDGLVVLSFAKNQSFYQMTLEFVIFLNMWGGGSKPGKLFPLSFIPTCPLLSLQPSRSDHLAAAAEGRHGTCPQRKPAHFQQGCGHHAETGIPGCHHARCATHSYFGGNKPGYINWIPQRQRNQWK